MHVMQSSRMNRNRRAPRRTTSALSQMGARLDNRGRWQHLKELVCQGKALAALESASHYRDWMDQVLQVPPSLSGFAARLSGRSTDQL